MTGTPGGPPVRASVSVCDVSAALYANQGILLALAARERTGRGQRVEASLFESQIALMLFRAVGYFATGKAPTGKMGSASPHLAPYEVYATADGDIMIAALNDGLYQKLTEALALPELASDPRFTTNALRVKNRNELNALLKARLAERATREWSQIITYAGVPCSGINTIADALNDPQTAARDMIMTLQHASLGEIKVPGIPIKLSDTPGSGRRAPPLLGQHQAEVLKEFGLSTEEIEAVTPKIQQPKAGH